MTPLLNNRQGSRLLVATLLFLFIGMEVSLLSWPMDPLENNHGKTTSSNRRQTLLIYPDATDEERQLTNASNEGVQENRLSDGTEIPNNAEHLPRRPLLSSRMSLGSSNLQTDSSRLQTDSSRLQTDSSKLQTENQDFLSDQNSLANSVVILEEAVGYEGKLPNEGGLTQSIISEYRALQHLAKYDEKTKSQRSQIIAQLKAQSSSNLNPSDLLNIALSRPLQSSSQLDTTSETHLLERLICYSLYNQVLESCLERRRAILPDDTETVGNSYQLNHQTLEALQLIATKGVELITTLLPTFQDAKTIDATVVNSLTAEQKISLCHTLSLIRKMQLFILGYSTDICITESKKKLDEIESFLDQIFSHKDGNISKQVETFYQASNDLLRTRKALFSLKETLSIEATIKAAQESAQLLENQLSKIRDSKQTFESLLTRADRLTVSSLQKEIYFMSQLELCLQDAIAIYYTIEDEAQIEQHYDSLHALKREIQDAASLLFIKTEPPDSTSSTSSNRITALIEPLSDNHFQLDSIASLPQHPSLFLENLERLNATSEANCIIGHRGKIFLEELADFRNDSYFLEHQPEWVLGINTIREGLRRGWGIHVVHAFDNQFSFMIEHKIALTVQDLKKFLFNSENKLKYARSFFISQEMIREGFLEYLKNLEKQLDQTSASFNKTIADQVIKFDAATLGFNPFEKKPITTSQESIEAADLRQRQAGFDRVREALKSAFPEASLLPKQLDEVLDTFDDQFKLLTVDDIDHKEPLTLARAATFINKQKFILKNRSYWKKYITPYLDYSALITSALNGLSYAIGSHLGTTILFALPYLYILWLNHVHHTISSST